jgi:MFS family permease
MVTAPADSAFAAAPHFTVSHAYLWTVSLVAALGGLLFGYDWVVIGGAAKFYEAFFRLADISTFAAGVSLPGRLWASLLSPVGWVLGCLLGALGSGFLSDRHGRKPLLLFGAAALTTIYAAIGICFQQKAGGASVPNGLFLSLVLSAIASYAMSLAPVTWVVIAEIFPTRIRGTAMAFAVGCLWAACFPLTYTFPIFNALLGPHMTFWIYAGICLTGFLFVLRYLPETKGRTLEEIEAELAS